MNEYTFHVWNFRDSYPELGPLYAEHYGEMRERLAGQGVYCAEFNPMLDRYNKASDEGWLITYLVRFNGTAVGYCNIYLTNDMHNGDLIAQEDALFVQKSYRDGVGKKLVRAVLDDLKERGVKRLIVSAATDLRVAKLWRRMGFQDLATQMQYTF